MRITSMVPTMMRPHRPNKASSLIVVSAQASLSRGSTSQWKWLMWLELQNGRLNVKLACRMELKEPAQ